MTTAVSFPPSSYLRDAALFRGLYMMTKRPDHREAWQASLALARRAIAQRRITSHTAH